MNIVLFGNYNPEYSRNRVILRALKLAGYRLEECRSSRPGWRSWIDLIKKRFRIGRCDLVFVLFPGHETVPLARMLFPGKPIVLDIFTSHYCGYIEDRARYAKEGFRARYYKFMDRLACRCADMVLLDTQEHINYFRTELRVKHPAFRRLWVGTDTSVFTPRPVRQGPGFRVHFHGHYIPHHGAMEIIRAAALLKGEGIEFEMVGRGQQYEECRSLANSLGTDTIHFIDNVPYARLADLMEDADVCLGVFGNNTKTFLTITNKVFEAAAMARPVITADTPAIRELFTDGEDILLCHAGDPRSLADAILRLRNDQSLRQKIASAARKTFEEACTEERISQTLRKYLDQSIE